MEERKRQYPAKPATLHHRAQTTAAGRLPAARPVFNKYLVKGDVTRSRYVPNKEGWAESSASDDFATCDQQESLFGLPAYFSSWQNIVLLP